MSDPYLVLHPVGSVIDYAGTPSSLPSGWLLCDGQAYSRSEYPQLFAAIGTTWGAGDGSTTFNVPDLRGRATIGAGKGDGLTERTLGQRDIGVETVTLTANQSGNQAQTISGGGHNHPVGVRKDNTTGKTAERVGNSSNLTSTVGAIPANTGTHSHSVAAKNAIEAHDNMPPSAVLLKIIRACSVSAET